ncbi:hypothetical protein SDC9_80235 [bioreactor metagenome]|uniref:Uncharacterized protein n=1 Tax=bioreactor metagenome TaxID=1076179 RepID=A0A644Z032_9ZZZZ
MEAGLQGSACLEPIPGWRLVRKGGGGKQLAISDLIQLKPASGKPVVQFSLSGEHKAIVVDRKRHCINKYGICLDVREEREPCVNLKSSDFCREQGQINCSLSIKRQHCPPPAGGLEGDVSYQVRTVLIVQLEKWGVAAEQRREQRKGESVKTGRGEEASFSLPGNIVHGTKGELG